MHERTRRGPGAGATVLAVLPLAVLLLGVASPALGGDAPWPPSDSDIVDVSERRRFDWETPAGAFSLSPYGLVQMDAQLGYSDTRPRALAGKGAFHDVGFGIPHAVVGAAGRAFDFVTFELALDAGCAGAPCLLREAWVDLAVVPEFRVRAGKLKTPMHRAALVRLGEAQLPLLPRALTTPITRYADPDARAPALQTGVDLGFLLHGVLFDRVEWQVGVFSGEGPDTNRPTSSVDDDSGVPALLYAARVAIAPVGLVPPREGGPGYPTDFRFHVAGSVSYDVEANGATSNDLRVGVEVVFSGGGFYASTELAVLWMDTLARPVDAPTLRFWALNTQVSYLLPFGLEPVVRFEMFERDSSDVNGVLVMPGGGLNWHIVERVAKLQFFYQYVDGMGYRTYHHEDTDFEGVAVHLAMVLFQLTL